MSEGAYELRPYQKECKEIIEKNPEGHHLVALATGLGKTVIFTHLETEGRTLILSHRDELVRQPEKFYKDRRSFGVEKAEEHSDGEEVVSASVQTLSQDKRLEQFSPDDFHTIIVDEAHHAAAKSYRKVLDYFTGAKLVLGFTATPKRGDNVRLTDVFDDIIFSRDLRWGIENGYLSRVRCLRVATDLDLRKVGKTAGDFNQGQLDRAIEESGAIPLAAKTYVQECHAAGRHTLIYCTAKDICFLLADLIRRLLPKEEANQIRVLLGDTPDDERKSILSGFMDGSIRCIVNCMVLTEGTDLPICDAVINLRPTCNLSLYQQMVGRSTRIYEGKEYSLIVDLIPEDGAKPRSLCTAPSLFGIDPSLLNGKCRSMLNPNVDLLELCNCLTDDVVDDAKQMKVLTQEYDPFLQDREELISENREKGFRSLASDYMQYIDSRRSAEGEWDFGNLDVEVQADESRYYRIKPNWYETIYLSKPDILGNTRIELNLAGVSGIGVPDDYLQGKLPMEEAVELVKNYCETQEDRFRYSWDRATQMQWQNLPATENQVQTICSKFRNSGISADDSRSLTKLEASKLIDMATEIKNRKQRKKEAELAASDKQTKTAIAARAKLEEEAKKKAPAKDSQAKLISFRDIVAKRAVESIARRQAALDAARRRLIYEDESGTFFYVVTNISCASGRDASKKQASYASALLLQAAIRKISLPGVMPDKMSMRQISALIDLLIACERAGITGPITIHKASNVAMQAENSVYKQVECKYYFTAG